MSPKKIKGLADKKFRTETGLFLVEGEKNIREVLASDFLVETILGTEPFLDSIETLVQSYEKRMKPQRVERTYADVETIERTGTLITNGAGIAVVRQKMLPVTETALADAGRNIVLVLDDVRDPGNLGTIIRIADWYGVMYIVASLTTTDLYNPKVIAATMGSFTRVTVSYAPLNDFLKDARALKLPIIATYMTGTSTHESRLPRNGLLLMGSESHGVNNEWLRYVTDRVTIPRFGKAESLNVSVATGIMLDTIHRSV